MRKFKIGIFFLTLIILTGCWDATELEEQAYVVAIGIDKGLEPDSSIVTLQIANPQVGSSDKAKADKEPPQTTISIAVPDKVVIRDLANISVSRRVTYEHTLALIISEEVMQSDDFFLVLEGLTRDPEFQRDMHLIVTKEKAYEFIDKNKPPLETRPHKNYKFMIERWKDTGLLPETTLNGLIQRTEADAEGFLAVYATAKVENEDEESKKSESDSGGGQEQSSEQGADSGSLEPKGDQHYGKEDEYLPGQVIKKGDNPTQMIGSVVIKEGIMIGTLTGEETRLTLLLREKATSNNWLAVYKDPFEEDKHITARVFKAKKTNIKVNVNDDNPKITCTVHLNLHILIIRSFNDYISDNKKQKELEKSIEKQLEKKAMELVKKTQSELEADIFQWSLPARKKFLTLKQYQDYDWMKSFPSAEIEVKFDVKITQFGKQLAPIDLDKIKD